MSGTTKKKKITVIGSINNDLVIRSPKAPRMGETVLGDSFMQVCGGKGANQAVSCARLNADAVFVGAVGDDMFGEVLRKNLIDNDVNVDLLRTVEDVPSGTAVILVHQGDNCIVVDSGANGWVDRAWIDRAEACIAASDMVVLQMEIPLDTVRYAMELCKRHGVKIMLNPAPAQTVGMDFLSMADWLTPNESEARVLTGIEADTVEGAKKALQCFMENGIKRTVITLGENGCVYNDEKAIRHVPAIHLGEVLDTTAAGDSFTAALAVALTEGRNMEEAVGFATRVAAITVTRKGAQPSLPYRHEVEGGV